MGKACRAAKPRWTRSPTSSTTPTWRSDPNVEIGDPNAVELDEWCSDGIAVDGFYETTPDVEVAAFGYRRQADGTWVPPTPAAPLWSRRHRACVGRMLAWVRARLPLHPRMPLLQTTVGGDGP